MPKDLLRSPREIFYGLFFLCLILLSLNIADDHAAPQITTHYFFLNFAKTCLIVASLFLLGMLWLRFRDRIPLPVYLYSREGIIPLVLLILSYHFFSDIFTPGFPSTTDHTTHILRSWLTEEALWQHGTFLPWTSAIGAGVPLNDLYPPGSYMLLCLFRTLTFFQIDLVSIYKFTVFFSWYLFTLSIYIFARKFFGIAAGAYASLLLLLDPGSVALWGYAQCFHHAVWPMTLSGAFFVLSVFMFLVILEKGIVPHRSILFSLTIACAVITHVFSLLAFTLNFVVFIVGYILLSAQPAETIRRALCSLIFMILGVSLTAWWLMPFFAGGEWTLPFGSSLPTTISTAHQAWNLDLFENTPRLLTALTYIGCIWGFMSGRPVAFVLSIGYLLNILVNSGHIYEWFYTENFARLFMSVPLYRFAAVSKIWGYILLGGMFHILMQQSVLQWKERLSPLLERAQSHPNSAQNHLVHAILVTLLLTFLFMPVLPALHAFSEILNDMRHRFIQTNEKNLAHYPDLVKAMQRIDLYEPDYEIGSFFHPLLPIRIGVQSNILESIIPYHFDYGIVCPAYMPTMVIRTRSTNLDPAAGSLSGMKYFLSLGDFAQFLESQGNMQAVFNTGEVTLVENLKYKRILCDFITPSTGNVELLSMKPGSIKYRFSDLPLESWVRFPLSRYRKWKAYLNGLAIPISEYIAPGESTDVGRYISVQVSSGILELSYENEWVDWAGVMITLTGFIILITCCFSSSLYAILSFRNRFFDRFLATGQTLHPITVFGTFSVTVFLLLFLFIWLNQSSGEGQFWFVGLSEDRVKYEEKGPDGIQDLELGLRLGKSFVGRTLYEIRLQELSPHPDDPARVWSTSNPKLWMIEGWSLEGEALELDKRDFVIKHPLKLRLFISNPYRDAYIPEKKQLRIILRFTDNTQSAFTCNLIQQGHF